MAKLRTSSGNCVPEFYYLEVSSIELPIGSIFGILIPIYR
jgi:hypothetical protein